ncbi:hypothetical protein AADG42_01570 [Ammonicoccus fulvus]|uniref:Extradiol ring-cleavage dioxygenase class III enzyme subunit B domain-containing protein n=1 Tax=Ammonicoccus fulvus TaxID=3138240 RepID=A0ABZ3FMK6_9ACTN
MADIVLGLAASHSPQLSAGADMWFQHAARDAKRSELVGLDGELHTFDELIPNAPEGLAAELKPEVAAAKYERTQAAMTVLQEKLAEADVDIAIVIGDDQWELFRDEGVPTFALYLGDQLYDEPKAPEVVAGLDKSLQAAQWAQHGDALAWHPTHAELSSAITDHLCIREFDISRFTTQMPDRTLGHAFTFPRYRMALPLETPIVPIFINTYFPPNVPTPGRCFDLGVAIAEAIANWDSAARVAVITSGGLSHFVVDERLDNQVLTGLRTGDRAAFAEIPRNYLRSGNSEILNWICAAGALTGLDPTIVDYVPGYRSEAGTGTGMAFAYWQ